MRKGNHLDSMQKIKKIFQQFFLIGDTPHKIAGGAALGIFLGIAPGEGVMATLVLASLFKLNRLAAMAGVALTNMWMTIAVLPFAAAVGGILFHTSNKVLINDFTASYQGGAAFFFSRMLWFDIALPLLTGFAVVAGSIALCSYGLIYGFLKYKEK